MPFPSCVLPTTCPVTAAITAITLRESRTWRESNGNHKYCAYFHRIRDHEEPISAASANRQNGTNSQQSMHFSRCNKSMYQDSHKDGDDYYTATLRVASAVLLEVEVSYSVYTKAKEYPTHADILIYIAD